MSANLRLWPFGLGDEDAALAGHLALAAEDFTLLLGYEAGEDWQHYLERLDRRSSALDLPAGLVPAHLLAATVDGRLVGRISIRHVLNEYLAAFGGHIGYAVLPGHRRRGYAEEILRQGLVVARALGVERVLLTCDDVNRASASVIERNGGVLDAVVQPPGGEALLRRYWID